jgi:aryl-alcohol dehydrogenase-like predicted oxidoreductase
MLKAISNTSPLLYLYRIGGIHWLPELFDEVWIREAVRNELLAEEKGLTAAQVALTYVMNQPMNLFAVVGPHSGEKFKAKIEASEVHLTPHEMDWLDLRINSR